jgi:hypothetical protein
VELFKGITVKPGSASQFALSDAGPLLFQAKEQARHELVWVSRAGGIEPVDPAWTGIFVSPALSPDATRLAVVIFAAKSIEGVNVDSLPEDVWIKQLDRGPLAKLTLDGSTNRMPTWTPDGGSVTFESNRNGEHNVWSQRADGSGPAVAQLPRATSANNPRWSPDGKWLVYRTGLPGDIWGFRPGRDTVAQALVLSRFDEEQAVVSPDGRWLAYVSNETGADEVYVRPFPNTQDAKWALTTSGGSEPVWSHSGTELFYRSGQRQMMAAKVRTKPTFAVVLSTVLFSDRPFVTNRFYAQYDVAPNDQRFIMIRPVSTTTTGALVVVMNLVGQLKRLAPK